MTPTDGDDGRDAVGTRVGERGEPTAATRPRARALGTLGGAAARRRRSRLGAGPGAWARGGGPSGAGWRRGRGVAAAGAGSAACSGCCSSSSLISLVTVERHDPVSALTAVGPLPAVIVGPGRGRAALSAWAGGLRRSARTLDSLVDATRRVEDGDYSVRVDVPERGLRPVRQLVRGFDTMVERLEVDERQRRRSSPT